jgi:hypothetical protein
MKIKTSPKINSFEFSEGISFLLNFYLNVIQRYA